MYFAYVDESGDSGYVNSPSRAFVLSVVLVHGRNWLAALDELVAVRRSLRQDFGIHASAELKANFIVQRKGIYKQLGLSERDRLSIYRRMMTFQSSHAEVLRTFAVVIDKHLVGNRQRDPRDFAWKMVIERLHTFSTRNDEFVKIMPDAGHGYFIRKLVRKMRRHHFVPSAFGTGPLRAEAQRIVEDPSDRQSHESHFVQLADLNAYAAARHIFPGKVIGQEMWNELGDARISEVNRLVGGPVGIKVFPT